MESLSEYFYFILFIYLKKYFYICDVSIKSLLNRKN